MSVEQIHAEFNEEVKARLRASIKQGYDLEPQIKALATVLMEEFGGPTENEAACEMAIRLLREYKRKQDFTYCAYCGAEFPLELPNCAELVDKHIATCEKHPLYRALRAVSEARWWARKLWCRILVEKEQNAAAIVWAYKAARGATHEACSRLLESANEEIEDLQAQHRADDELVERVVRRHDEADKTSWRLLEQNAKLETTLAEVRDQLCATRLRMWELEKRVTGEGQDA